MQRSRRLRYIRCEDVIVKTDLSFADLCGKEGEEMKDKLTMWRGKGLVVLNSAHPDQQGTVYYVPRDHITSWYKSVDTGADKTVVFLSDHRTYDVLETPDDIAAYF